MDVQPELNWVIRGTRPDACFRGLALEVGELPSEQLLQDGDGLLSGHARYDRLLGWPLVLLVSGRIVLGHAPANHIERVLVEEVEDGIWKTPICCTPPQLLTGLGPDGQGVFVARDLFHDGLLDLAGWLVVVRVQQMRVESLRVLEPNRTPSDETLERLGLRRVSGAEVLVH
jgi:hypothetical protein